MPYQPSVQDISGQLLAQGMQQRAQGISSGIQGLFQGLQQNQMMTNQALGRFQAALAANSALLNALNGAQNPNDPTGVKLNPDVIKAYAEIKSGKTNVQNTALLAQFADTYNQAQANQQKMQLQAAQAANFQAQAAQRQQELEQLKKMADIFKTMQDEDRQKKEEDRINAHIAEQDRILKEEAAARAAGQGGAGTSTAPAGGSKYRRINQATDGGLQRGTGEMSLMSAASRFALPTQTPESLQGAAAFDLPSFGQQPSSAAQARPAAEATTPASAYDVPLPPVPDWFKPGQASDSFRMDLALSPEAKAIASQLRRQYEESQDPSLRTISAPELGADRRKRITLDAEGIRAILSNPRILVESFADLAGDPYQQGLRRERLDRIMQEQEQLRTLQQMMRNRRAR